jgi:hypothetical protein
MDHGRLLPAEPRSFAKLGDKAAEDYAGVGKNAVGMAFVTNHRPVPSVRRGELSRPMNADAPSGAGRE